MTNANELLKEARTYTGRTDLTIESLIEKEGAYQFSNKKAFQDIYLKVGVVTLTLEGEDAAALRGAAQELAGRLEGLEGVEYVLYDIEPDLAWRLGVLQLRPDELALLPDEDGLLRARLWGAKEAAFKAARLDDGFRPCSVEIEDLGRTGFRWSARREHGPLCGQGIFTAAGAHLVAVAVEAPTITAHQARSV